MGRKALITCADRYMGPAIRKKFESIGLTVLPSFESLKSERAVDDLLNCCGGT